MSVILQKASLMDIPDSPTREDMEAIRASFRSIVTDIYDRTFAGNWTAFINDNVIKVGDDEYDILEYFLYIGDVWSFMGYVRNNDGVVLKERYITLLIRTTKYPEDHPRYTWRHNEFRDVIQFLDSRINDGDKVDVETHVTQHNFPIVVELRNIGYKIYTSNSTAEIVRSFAECGCGGSDIEELLVLLGDSTDISAEEFATRLFTDSSDFFPGKSNEFVMGIIDYFSETDSRSRVDLCGAVNHLFVTNRAHTNPRGHIVIGDEWVQSEDGQFAKDYMLSRNPCENTKYYYIMLEALGIGVCSTDVGTDGGSSSYQENIDIITKFVSPDIFTKSSCAVNEMALYGDYVRMLEFRVFNDGCQNFGRTTTIVIVAVCVREEYHMIISVYGETRDDSFVLSESMVNERINYYTYLKSALEIFKEPVPEL